MNLLVLIFAHLLGDYPLQGDFLANFKGKNPIVLLSHAGIWTGTVLTALHLLGFNVTVFDAIWMFLVHAIADYLKASNKLWYKNMDSLKGGLLIDQAIHLSQLMILLFYKIY